MNIKLDKLVNSIQPYVQGIPTTVILKEIMDVARDFCDRSSVWKDYLDTIDQKAGNQFVDLSLPKGVEISRINKIICNNKELEQLLDEEAAAIDINYFNEDAKEGEPMGYVMVSADNAVLVPRPKKDAKIRVFATLRPTSEDGKIAHDIYNEYSRYITSGVLGKFYLIKNEPFYDQRNAQYKRRDFVFGIQKARGAANYGNRSKPIKWKMERFVF